MNSAWSNEAIAEKLSLVVKKSGSGLGICVTQLKDTRGWVEDTDLFVEFDVDVNDLVV